MVYLTIIPWGRVGYEMIDSQRGVWHGVGCNHLISNKREWNNNIVLLKTPTKSCWISPTRTNRKRQGTSAVHMSHIYQNCQRANGLAWTAWMKNQNIAAMKINFLKTHRDSRILHSRTAKKTWQIMWRKRIFKGQASKLLWIWIFGADYKSKNNGEKLLPRLLVIKLFEATSWFCWTRKEAILPPWLL